MSNVIRHQGVVRSTGSRVFVVWRQLPDDPEHCLVIYRDSLPEVYAYAVTELVETKGQASIDLWEVMDKVGYLDNRKMLDVLHSLSYLRKQRTSDIDMHVGGGTKYSLDLLNRSLEQHSSTEHVSGKVKEYNPYDKQESPENFAEKGTIVDKLLADAAEAGRLQQEYLERAYAIEPSLRPKPTVTEQPVVDTDKRTFFIELPDDISQTKAIEAVKKALKERKV